MILKPLIGRNASIHRTLGPAYTLGRRFLSSGENRSRLSYVNLLSQEKPAGLSKLDFREWRDTESYNTFSTFIDNYKNKVRSLSQSVASVESFFRQNSDPAPDFEYEIAGSHAYYLSPLQSSVRLCRTCLQGLKRKRKDVRLESFIAARGKPLLNFAELAAHGVSNVKKMKISPNGDLISLLHDSHNTDTYNVAFYSVRQRRLLRATLNDVGEIYFMHNPQNARFTRVYYTQLNEQKRSHKLFTSLLSTKSGMTCSKRLLYSEPVNFISLFRSKGGKALFAATTSYNRVFSTFLINARAKMFTIPTVKNKKVLLEFRSGLVYCVYSDLESYLHKIPLRSLRLYPARFRQSSLENCSNLGSDDLSSEGQALKLDCTVTDIDMFNRALVLYLQKPPSSPSVALMNFPKLGYGFEEDGKEPKLTFVQLPVQVGSVEPAVNMNYNTNSVRFNLNSPGQPWVTLDLDLRTHEFKRVANLDPSVKSFVLHVPARDGSCKIPLTVVARGAELEKPGDLCSRKCMLYAYGFYGESLSVCNYVEHAPLLHMGYVLCFAHLRGGGELGEAWQKMGTKANKQNSFYDLVDVMQYLIAKKVTTRALMALSVSSAAGILGGCVYNMRPDLCSVILLKLPYLDLFGTVQDPMQPLVELEYEEFGETGEGSPFLDRVYSLDPCSNVNPRTLKRPALIVNCDENDVRAPWYHAEKFLTLAGGSKDGENLLVRISSHGHDGDPPYEYLLTTASEEVALIDYFLSKHTQTDA